jgi:hypothetical protein
MVWFRAWRLVLRDVALFDQSNRRTLAEAGPSSPSHPTDNDSQHCQTDDPNGDKCATHCRFEGCLVESLPAFAPHIHLATPQQHIKRPEHGESESKQCNPCLDCIKSHLSLQAGAPRKVLSNAAGSRPVKAASFLVTCPPLRTGHRNVKSALGHQFTRSERTGRGQLPEPSGLSHAVTVLSAQQVE